MAFKMPELKRARDIIVEKCGLSSGDAARVIGLFNTGGASGVPRYDIISNILAGDFSAVPGACAALDIKAGSAPAGSAARSAGSVKDPGEAVPTDIKTGDGAGDIKPGEATPGASTGQKSTKNKAKNKNIPVKQKDKAPAGGVHAQRVQDMTRAELYGDNTEAEELPPGFVDNIRLWLDMWAESENIDLSRLHAQQWRAACMFIGEKIKQSHVLNDDKWIHSHGGRGYSGKRLEALLDVWAYLCGKYKQVPLVSDFVYFSGTHKNYFYDYGGQGLSSTSVAILKKARDIEEAGLGASVAGGGPGAVGGMFLLKARHNYSETVTIQHTSATTALGVAELPLLEVKKP